MASTGLRRIVYAAPRVARDPEIPAGSDSAEIGKSSDRECPKRAISWTGGVRTDPSQAQLDCAATNIDARLSRRGSGVWFNRPDSKSGEPNGSGGSNPSLSATQSVEFTYNLEKAANPRVGEPIRAARGTGERDQSCKSRIRRDSSLFRRDSVPRADSVRSPVLRKIIRMAAKDLAG